MGEEFKLIGELLLAAACGAALGLERELHRKPAGLRTNMLIAVGAALFTHASIAIFEKLGQHGDPARIAAQVVVGIGFIGAGTILRHEDQVIGLTSAATVWVVAALGLLVGADMGIHAVTGTVLALLILHALMRLEGFIDARTADGQARLVAEDREALLTDITAFFRARGIGLKSIERKELGGGRVEVKVQYFTLKTRHAALRGELGKITGVLEHEARIM